MIAAEPHETASRPIARPLLAVVLIALNSGFCFCGRLIFGLLSEPVKGELGFSDTQIGLLTGFSLSLAYVLFLLPCARLIDRYDRRLLLTGAGLAFLAGTALTVTSSAFAVLLAARMLVAAAEATVMMVTVSVVPDLLPPHRWPLGNAIMTTGAYFSLALGFAIVGLAEPLIGWRLSIALIGAVYLAIFLAVIWLYRDNRVITAEDRAPFRTTLKALGAKHSFPFVVAIATLFGFAQTAAVTWLPAVLIRTHGFDQSQASNFLGLGIGLLAGTVVLIAGSFLSRARATAVEGPLRIGMILAATMASLYLAGLALHGPLALALLMIGLAISGIMNPIWMSAVHDLTEPRNRATAFALVLIPDCVLGGGGGPVLTGAISDALMPGMGDGAIAVALLITVPSAWLVSWFCCTRASRAISRDTMQDTTDRRSAGPILLD